MNINISADFDKEHKIWTSIKQNVTSPKSNLIKPCITRIILNYFYILNFINRKCVELFPFL